MTFIVTARRLLRAKAFRPAILILLQGLLGVVFLMASVDKLAFGREPLVRMFLSLGPIPTSRAVGAATALSVFEAVLGLALLTGLAQRTSLVVALLFLFLMTSALIFVGIRLGWAQDCGCGFIMSASSVRVGIIRNLNTLSRFGAADQNPGRESGACSASPHGRQTDQVAPVRAT